MNKLYASLLVAKSFGWRNDLSKEAQKSFDSLLEKAVNITDDDLTEADLNVIKVIDSYILERQGGRCQN